MFVYTNQIGYLESHIIFQLLLQIVQHSGWQSSQYSLLCIPFFLLSLLYHHEDLKHKQPRNKKAIHTNCLTQNFLFSRNLLSKYIFVHTFKMMSFTIVPCQINSLWIVGEWSEYKSRSELASTSITPKMKVCNIRADVLDDTNQLCGPRIVLLVFKS